MTLAQVPSSGSAQAYPAKPVRIILPYLGSTEFAGRWIAANAAPDGYTLMLAAPPLVINPHLYPQGPQSKQPGMDALRDYLPIAMLGTIPSVLAVHPAVPAKSVRELVALAHKYPGKLTYGSGAPGSPSHLAGELLKSLSKTNILLVPYKGATFALVGAMSGEVDVVIPAASAVEPYVNDKRMRALAVLHTKPVAALPGVPVAAEAGMPQLLIVNWFVLAAPAGTPRVVIERLNAEVNKVIRTAESQKHFAALGGNVTTGTPEQAGAFVREESERWGKVIRDANIRVTE